MGSIFERMSAKDIQKYILYINKTIGGSFFDLLQYEPGEFLDEVYEYGKKLSAPLGRELDRLDYEYLYQLFMNLETDFLDATEEDIESSRPNLDSHNVNWVREERQYVTIRSEGYIDSYLDSNTFGSDYVDYLSGYDHIDPWSWEELSHEIDDSDTTDSWFEV
jgi:hypothetical protein